MGELTKAIEVLDNVSDYIIHLDEYGICYKPEFVRAVEVARKALKEKTDETTTTPINQAANESGTIT